MIEITWGQIRQTNLVSSLEALARQKVGFKTTLKILNILRKIENEQKKAQKAAEIITEKYLKEVEKEVEGGKKIKTFDLKSDDLKDEYQKTAQEYIETKFTINHAKISAEELDKCTLSTLELVALEPVVDLGEDVEKIDVDSNVVGLNA